MDNLECIDSHKNSFDCLPFQLKYVFDTHALPELKHRNSRIERKKNDTDLFVPIAWIVTLEFTIQHMKVLSSGRGVVGSSEITGNIRRFCTDKLNRLKG